MNKKIILIGVVVVLVVVFVSGLFLFTKSTIAPSPSQPTPSTPRKNLLLRDDSYQRGASNAPVTIVEFIDFACEACAFMHPIVQRILDEYEGKVRLVVRYWPLDQHKNAKAAVYAAEAAGELGKYWEMYDKLMTNQQQWSEANSFFDVFAVMFAKELDLNGFPGDFQTAVDKFATKVERDTQDAKALAVKGVPDFYINGVNYGYIQSYQEFKEKLEKELALCDRTTMTEEDIQNGRLLCSLR